MYTRARAMVVKALPPARMGDGGAEFLSNECKHRLHTTGKRKRAHRGPVSGARGRTYSGQVRLPGSRTQGSVFTQFTVDTN